MTSTDEFGLEDGLRHVRAGPNLRDEAGWVLVELLQLLHRLHEEELELVSRLKRALRAP